jgi:hypothetical protein
MTKRRWLLVAVILALVVVVAAGVAVHARRHTLSYSVSSGEGHISVKVADERNGRHTVWMILRSSRHGPGRVLFRSYRDGSLGGQQSVAARPHLVAGAYTWSVYTADGLYLPNDAKYWTAEHLVDRGEVTVW